MTTPDDAHLTLNAEPAAIAAARSALGHLAEEAGADQATVHAVRLAVTEAVTNVVRHAYAGRTDPGEVRVAAHVERHDPHDHLTVAISDDGPGVLPRADSPGLGMGLPMMSGLATAVDITNEHPGATVRLRFDLS